VPGFAGTHAVSSARERVVIAGPAFARLAHSHAVIIRRSDAALTAGLDAMSLH
jgi:hypothetical protein